jgi:excisionase family DNA binding protein
MLKDDLLPGAIAAAAYVGVKPRSIYHMTEAGQLPVIRKGKRLYFRKSELDRAFSSEATALYGWRAGQVTERNAA